MVRTPFVFICAFVFSTLSQAVQAASDRVALVIGNGAYSFATRLANPTNDAGDIAKALREIGFDVVDGTDLDRRSMETKIREFSRKLGEARIALFFYAGHGLQVGGKNYLVPIDAKLEQAGDLSLDTVDVQVVLQQMEAQRRVNLVFLDACRDNPLARSFARSLGASRSASVGQGLASIQSAIGTMIAFATQPDNVALDGSGRNSPFTTALVKHIRTPGIDIAVMMRRVRTDVIATTGERQVPWDHSSLTDAVVLVPGSGAPAVTAAAPPPAVTVPAARPPVPPPPVAAQPSSADAERAWAVTKDTTSPAVLEAFIRRFGKTIYGEMASARVRELKAAAPKTSDKVAMATPTATPTPAAPSTPSLTGTWQGQLTPHGNIAVMTLVQSSDGRLTGKMDLKGTTFTDSEISDGRIHGNRVTLVIKLKNFMTTNTFKINATLSAAVSSPSMEGTYDWSRPIEFSSDTRTIKLRRLN